MYELSAFLRRGVNATNPYAANGDDALQRYKAGLEADIALLGAQPSDASIRPLLAFSGAEVDALVGEKRRRLEDVNRYLETWQRMSRTINIPTNTSYPTFPREFLDILDAAQGGGIFSSGRRNAGGIALHVKPPDSDYVRFTDADGSNCCRFRADAFGDQLHRAVRNQGGAAQGTPEWLDTRA